MSFRDCITSAVQTGRVSEAKGDKAKEAYDKEMARLLSEGMSTGDAALQAAIEATEAMTRTTKERRWQKLNEIQRAHEIHTRLSGADDINSEIHMIMQDLELSFDTVMGFAMANLDEFLIEYRPTAAGLRRPTAGLDEIPRAAYGQSTDAKAQRMAEAIQKTMEVLRVWANRYGANIPDNPNNRLFQTHDAIRVSSVPMDEWVNDHLQEGVLDWEVMRYRGQKILPGERKAVLEQVYKGIVSDGYDDVMTSQVRAPGLATRLNRDRFLYYASGDAWNSMQKKYGAGNVHEQIISMVDAMSKDISVLMHLGPSPDQMMEFMKRDALNLASERDLAAGANQRKQLNSVRRRMEVARREYEIHSRHTPTVESNWAVQAFTTVKTLAVNALLGGVFIPSFFSDQINARAARNLLNMPANKAFSNYYREFVMTPEKIQEAITAGVIFEHGISIASNRVRYFGLMDGPKWARDVGEFTYRFGLTSHHTQVARNAAGKSFQEILFNHRNMEFYDLPFSGFFAEHGITKADWDAMRVTPVYDFKGAKFLRPIDLHRAGGAEAAAKFGNAMQMFIRTAVPDASLRARAAIGAWIDPNTPVGQAVRTMTSLMSFPVTIYFNHLRRISQAENKLSLMAKYFAWMTLGGMFITNTKALVNGQEPYMGLDEEGNFNPLTARGLDFIGRSVVNGGSLGILGDALFNTIDIANSGYRPGNPTEEYIESLLKLTLGNAMRAVDPEKETSVAKDALIFAQKNIPEFWQTKLIVRRYLTDELLREADPAAWERKKRYEQEQISDSWWGMGEQPEF